MEELPFLYVQLAPFEAWNQCTGNNFPELRRQQQMVEDSVSGVWMASIMDVGSRYDIHPKKKKPVGERLALLALGKVYGCDLDCQSPRVEKVTREGDKIMVAFSHAEGGLYSEGEVDSLFGVMQGGRRLKVSARVQGNTVELAAAGLQEAKPAELTFAHLPYAEVKLYNRAGLPARPCAPIRITENGIKPEISQSYDR